jgi:hypothetical protein
VLARDPLGAAAGLRGWPMLLGLLALPAGPAAARAVLSRAAGRAADTGARADDRACCGCGQR